MTTRKLTYININDPVSAAVANKPLSQLDSKTEQLQERLDATDAGNALIYRDIPCNEDVQVGMPVYWDAKDQTCKPAYLSAEVNEITQEYETGTPADCIGLVYRKNSAYSADLLVAGIIDFPEISSYLDGGTGRFFLGGAPGTLSLTPNAQAFPIGVVLGSIGPCDSAYRVYINPSYTNNLLQHQHYSVTLNPENWVDSSELLLDHEDAPDNTAYFYDVENDENLSKLWPPIPLGAISATIDWNEANPGGKVIPVNELNSLIQIDETTIYWTSAIALPRKITIHFSRVQYSTRNSFVTSIKPDINQPLQFVDCNGQEAESGNLYARFTLKDDPIDATKFEGTALGRFTEDWRSEKVPVVNGIRLTGNGTVPEGTPTFKYDGDTYYKGLITLDLSSYAPNTEISPQIIKVGAAQEREAYGITYLGLPAGRTSSLKLKFEIPGNYSSSSISFKLRMQCIAIIDGYYATAAITYFKIPRATTSVPLPATSHSLPCSFATDINDAPKMFEIESDPVTVTAGDTVVITITRYNDTTYNADLAIARIQGILNIQEESENAN